ncbi:MAG: hypothetical protein DRI74_09260 [Bacteroidetes bacterium]|nr:MAG: hypothetical protein DRI74_09260 [Bacteroidota bacterium]
MFKSLIKHFSDTEKANNVAFKIIIIVFWTRIFSMFLSFLTNILVARSLTPDGYGSYKLVASIALFLIPIFDFGVFTSIGYLLANTKDKLYSRKLIGTGSLLGFIFGVFFFVSFIAVSYHYLGLRIHGISKLDILFLGVFTIAMPLQSLIPQISKGSKPYTISVFNVSYSAFFFVTVLLLMSLSQLSVRTVLFSFFVSNFIAAIISIGINYPIFKDLQILAKEVFTTTKRYGIRMYIGQITANLMLKVDVLVLAMFRDTREVGIYGAAMLFLLPIVALSQAIGIVSFRYLAHDPLQLRKFEILNYMWLGMAIIGLMVLTRPIIFLLFGAKYSDVFRLMPFVAAAAFFQGGYQVKASFLASRGYSKETMLASILMMIVELLTIFIFTKIWGASGTLLSMALTYFTYWAAMQYFVRRIQKHEIRVY